MIPTEGHADADAARRCLHGELLAEELTTTARELVVAWAHARGPTDAAVAARTGMTTYTAARIRARLCLAAHRSF
ncbi:hypothetical protein [Kutzneria buriramensis]|uniref:hypothetical protein n=1 Tax=Kutzneria buriramensis TaxID=1045776 RepID=UPI000E22B981|nr:hypothetical protein [Kutzneria buriramensis]